MVCIHDNQYQKFCLSVDKFQQQTKTNQKPQCLTFGFGSGGRFAKSSVAILWCKAEVLWIASSNTCDADKCNFWFKLWSWKPFMQQWPELRLCGGYNVAPPLRGPQSQHIQFCTNSRCPGFKSQIEALYKKTFFSLCFKKNNHYQRALINFCQLVVIFC